MEVLNPTFVRLKAGANFERGKMLDIDRRRQKWEEKAFLLHLTRRKMKEDLYEHSGWCFKWVGAFFWRQRVQLVSETRRFCCCWVWSHSMYNTSDSP